MDGGSFPDEMYSPAVKGLNNPIGKIITTRRHTAAAVRKAHVYCRNIANAKPINITPKTRLVILPLSLVAAKIKQRAEPAANKKEHAIIVRRLI